jgi:tetratricopeptide (TPR) repeat protein
MSDAAGPSTSSAVTGFADEITRGAALFEAGRLAEAAEVFKRLCEQEDLPRTGRSIAAVNLAVTYDKMGHPDHAVATHEYGVGVATTDYVFAQENRAAYLHAIGRVADAIAVWEHLLTLEFLPADRAAAFRQNLDVAAGRA